MTARAPVALLQAILASDNASQGKPQMPPGRRPESVEWFTKIMVDSNIRAIHVNTLAGLLNTRGVQFSGDGTQNEVNLDTLYAQFPIRPPVSMEDQQLVVDEGPGFIPDDVLAELLINPRECHVLADMIRDSLSHSWWSSAVELQHRRSNERLPQHVAAVLDRIET